MYDVEQDILRQAQFLQDFPEELMFYYDCYLEDEFDDDLRQHSGFIRDFVDYCVEKSNKQFVKKRGEEGWTNQQILNEQQR